MLDNMYGKEKALKGFAKMLTRYHLLCVTLEMIFFSLKFYVSEQQQQQMAEAVAEKTPKEFNVPVC